MKTSDLYFELPRELIAQEPPPERGLSRLMITDRESGAFSHGRIADLPEYIKPGTVMVFNDSRVRRARIYARPVGGGAEQEFLLVAPRDPDRSPEDTGTIDGHRRWLVIGPNTRKLKPGRTFQFDPGDIEAEITAVEEPYRELAFSRPVTEAWLEQYGHIPLPPYIHRDDTPADSRRYQTIYARSTGSVAAPTAGLHFTEPLLAQLRKNGVEIAFVTLHVGIGTFLPVRTETLEDHMMHREEFTVSPEAANAINRARAEGRPVLAVGTTAVRTLETAGADGTVVPGHRDTGIFIYPGYRYRIVDQLFTNFHTPESTLLALVSAFAGREQVLRWYNAAIKERYRFFSYGDAMLIR